MRTESQYIELARIMNTCTSYTYMMKTYPVPDRPWIGIWVNDTCNFSAQLNLGQVRWLNCTAATLHSFDDSNVAFPKGFFLQTPARACIKRFSSHPFPSIESNPISVFFNLRSWLDLRCVFFPLSADLLSFRGQWNGLLEKKKQTFDFCATVSGDVFSLTAFRMLFPC